MGPLSGIDQFLTAFAALFQRHQGFIMTALVFGFVAFIFVSAGVSEALRTRAKRKERLAMIARGEMPETETVNGSRRRGRGNGTERMHYSLLSRFIRCAAAIKDPEVQSTVVALADLSDRIYATLMRDKKLTPLISDFMTEHAPKTLDVAEAYQTHEAHATTVRLKTELRRTGRALEDIKGDFSAILAKCEEGEAGALAIMTEVRRRISAYERPFVADDDADDGDKLMLPTPTSDGVLRFQLTPVKEHELTPTSTRNGKGG
jgi:hypothetical protein